MLTLRNREINFSLKVCGYEFPKSNDEWDANWLLIKVQYENEIENIVFAAEDPSLLTMELVTLKNWFVSLKQTRETSEVRFIESNLSFSYFDNSLTVFLANNLNPHGLDSKTYSFIIEVSLDKLIQEMDKMILKFPKKFNPK